MSDIPRIAEDAHADHAADLYSMAGSRVCCDCPELGIKPTPSRLEQPMSEPYRVPGIMNPRLAVWAIDCEGCGGQVRMGPGSKAGILRLLAAVGHRKCNECRA